MLAHVRVRALTADPEDLGAAHALRAVLDVADACAGAGPDAGAGPEAPGNEV